MAAALLACFCAAAQPANNPIFYGGSADGHSTGRNTPLPAANQGGGNGDGSGGGTSGAGLAANQYGGIADGAALGRNIPTPAITNSGGAGDGWSVGAKAAPTSVTNAGGVGDGWNSIAKAAPLPVTNGGGPGDGWSAQTTIPALASNQRGGIGDGWSSNTVITSLAPPVALPMQFLSFNARKDGEDALLNWKMGSEEGVTRYIVQRSSNAVSFEAIGEVAQRAGARGAYSFLDLQPLPGHNYYRIRVVLASGQELTPVRLLVFTETAPSIALKLYPNPATTRITAGLPAAWLGSNTVLNVYSAAGTLVLQQKMTPLGAQDIPLAIDALAPGVYTLQAATDGASLRATFVKR